MVAVRVLSTYSSFLSTKLSLSNARVLSFLKWSQPITSGKHHGCVGGNGDDDNEDDGGIAGGGAGIPTGNTVGEEVWEGGWIRERQFRYARFACL